MKEGIWWLIGVGGIGGLALFIALFPPALALLKTLLETKAGRIAVAVAVAIIGLFAFSRHERGQGAAVEKARQKKENDDFKDKVKRNDEAIHRLPDSDLDKRLRSKTGKPRVG